MPQILRERFYLREPRTDRLRKSASARLRHLIATGWRETDRSYSTDYVAVAFERPGQAPEKLRPAPVASRPPRTTGRPRPPGGRAGR